MKETDRVFSRVLVELIGSYRSDRKPRINHIGGGPLPSREAVIEILRSLRKILYPGYFGRHALDDGNLEFGIGGLLEEAASVLVEQIAHSLTFTGRSDDPEARAGVDSAAARADSLCASFLSRLPELREVLREDVEAAYAGDPAATGYDEIIYSYPGVRAVTVYRLAHELHLLEVPLLPRIMTEYAHGETGIDIHPGARIGRSFFIDHGAGVVIGETAVIGDRVKIYQGVTLGALSFPTDAEGNLVRGRKRHPTIEDDVVIYAGATVLGGETVIGKGATVGGNVWLTESVEAGAVVVIAKPDLKIRVPGKARKRPTRTV